jgi:hypothetical protein
MVTRVDVFNASASGTAREPNQVIGSGDKFVLHPADLIRLKDHSGVKFRATAFRAGDEPPPIQEQSGQI